MIQLSRRGRRYLGFYRKKASGFLKGKGKSIFSPYLVAALIVPFIKNMENNQGQKAVKNADIWTLIAGFLMGSPVVFGIGLYDFITERVVKNGGVSSRRLAGDDEVSGLPYYDQSTFVNLSGDLAGEVAGGETEISGYNFSHLM